MTGNADIPGGGMFTIAVEERGSPNDTNPLGFGTADLYVDHDNDNAFSLIAPDIGAQTATIIPGDTPTPQCNLDTVHTTHQNRFLANGTASGGQFLQGVVGFFSAVPPVPKDWRW
ncbi:MAG: hypothetical protein R3C20_03160 [Planctomycetaceae bacterium]